MSLSLLRIADFDFCGSIAGLMYNGRRRYKSRFGGFITLLAGIAILIIAGVYLKIFFNRETPKMNSNNLKYYTPPRLDISSNFIVAIMMQIENSNEFRDDLIRIEVEYKKKDISSSTIIPIQIVKCNRTDFKSQESLYDSLELHKAICLNLDGISIEGSNVNDIFDRVTVKFLLCLESDSKGECYNNTLMEKYFEKSKPQAIVYFLDAAFNTNAKTNDERVKRFINYVETNVTFNNAKETNIYFSQNEMDVDESYFFQSAPTIFSYFMIDSFRDLVSVRTVNQKEALLINLMSSKNQQIINISFMQLSELLANISSLTNVVILIISTLGDFVNHFFFQNDLINALYNFDKGKQNKKTKLKIKYSLSNSMKGKGSYAYNGNNKSKHEHKNPKESNMNIIEDEKDKNSLVRMCNNYISNSGDMKQRKQSQTQIMNKKIMNNICSNSDNIKISNVNSNVNTLVVYAQSFSTCDIFTIAIFYFFDCFKCKTLYTKKRYFKLIENSMESFQDFINMFKKLQEIDILKFLLFTDEQLSMYGIIPKPECRYQHKYIPSRRKFSVEKLDFSSLYHSKQFHYLKSFKEINQTLMSDEKVLQQLKMFFDKNDKTEVDKRLIRILKDRIDITEEI